MSAHVMAGAAGSTVVGNHFRVGKKIGEGSFGVIFEGLSLLPLPPTSVADPDGSDATGAYEHAHGD